MATIRPDELPTTGSVNPASALITDDGVTVNKATPLQVVDAARPKATESEAQAGADNEKLMTPLRVSQAIASLGVSSADLASPDPGEGSDLVGYKAPYTDTVARTIGGKFPDVVGVTDFGPSSDATTAFTRALAAAAEYGRDLYVPKLDAGAKYVIGSDLILPDSMRISGGGSGSGSGRVDPGSLLEFEDASLNLVDGAGLTLENFRVSRTGSTSGAAIECSATTLGFARNVFNNISVIGSNDIGVRMSGGWLFSWFNPYVRQCRIGLLIEEGAFATGMNSISLFGGEFHGNTEAAIVLDRCKQFNLVGTAVEGQGLGEGNLGVGIGVGRSCAQVSILGYFEANKGGHIMPYSHNGGAAGRATALVVEGGSYFLRGTGATQAPNDIHAISLPGCRSAYIKDGITFSGYATQTTEIVHVADVGDSNRAAGYLGKLYTDAPEELILKNDALFFGKATRRSVPYNANLPDATISDEFPLFVSQSSPEGLRNPSTSATLFIYVEAAGAGNLVHQTLRYDGDGVQIGPTLNNTSAVSTGFNRISVSIGDSNDLARIDWRNYSSSTATGVKLLGLELHTRENPVRSV